MRDKKLHWGLGGCYGFLTGDLKDGITYDFIDHFGRLLVGCDVGRWLGRYPESLAEKKFFPGSGWVGVFVQLKDQFADQYLYVIRLTYVPSSRV